MRQIEAPSGVSHPFPARFGFDAGAPPSAQILDEVLNALHWDCAVPRHRLSVKVENGWVTMSGEVDRPYERSRAEADARLVRGVVGVVNDVRLRASPGAKQLSA